MHNDIGTAVAAMLPPVVVDGPDGTLAPAPPPADAVAVRTAETLTADPRFAPLVRTLDHIDTWGAARSVQHEALIRCALHTTNSGLYTPLVQGVMAACHLMPAHDASDVADLRTTQFLEALDVFLARAHRDLASAAWPTDPRFAGPIVGLSAADGETHNRGQRVLKVQMAGGAEVAYKPRPANGEAFFGGLFALLNSLTPASGPIQLANHGVWCGAAGSCWQEWIDPPARAGVVRTDGSWTMTGTVLPIDEACEYWRRAGHLAAVSSAFGISDLIASNVLPGARGGFGDPQPMPYPIDLECSFSGAARLQSTCLVRGPDAIHHYQPGFDAEASWRSRDSGGLVLRRGNDGTLRLDVADRPLARLSAPEVVADDAGRIGFAPYLDTFLRGMFDAWTLLCRHRDRIRTHVQKEAQDLYIRVLLRPTADYASLIDARLRGREPDGDISLGPDELRQLQGWDVPYYLRAATGGPMLVVASAEPPVLEPIGTEPGMPGLDRYREPTLAGLGPAIRDAVLCAGAAPEPVGFDWHEAGKRVVYEWDDTTIRTRIEPILVHEQAR